jgi:hypothetical protein
MASSSNSATVSTDEMEHRKVIRADRASGNVPRARLGNVGASPSRSDGSPREISALCFTAISTDPPRDRLAADVSFGWGEGHRTQSTGWSSSPRRDPSPLCQFVPISS